MVESRAQAFARLPVLFDEADDRLDTKELIGCVVGSENRTVLMPSAPRLLAAKPASHDVVRAEPTPRTAVPSTLQLAAISGMTFLVALGTAGIAFYLFG